MNQICPLLERQTRTVKTSLGRDSWEIVRCVETGFTFLANPPKYEQLQSEFAWEKTYASEKVRRQEAEPAIAIASEVAKEIKNRLSPKRNRIASIAIRAMRSSSLTNLRLLDIGCGTGDLMVEMHHRFSLLQKKVEPVGIEVSQELSNQAESRIAPLGGRIVRNNAIDGCLGLADSSFDVVMMSCFLEHEARPLALLKSVYPLLSKQGVVVIKVPNFACWNRHIRGKRWCGFRFPDHVNYFTPSTLKRVVIEAGFPAPKQSWLDCFPFNDNMYAILRK